MKVILLLSILLVSSLSYGKELSFDKYLSSFTYEERKNMKISYMDLVQLLEEGKVQIVDIRFKEEFALWSIRDSINIPINELPSKLNKLDKNKLIVTVCPHLDRAALARHFLKLKGFNVKYLKDGLITLMDREMRGDDAKDLYNTLKKRNKK